jgi:hypothetical protein
MPSLPTFPAKRRLPPHPNRHAARFKGVWKPPSRRARPRGRRHTTAGDARKAQQSQPSDRACERQSNGTVAYLVAQGALCDCEVLTKLAGISQEPVPPEDESGEEGISGTFWEGPLAGPSREARRCDLVAGCLVGGGGTEFSPEFSLRCSVSTSETSPSPKRHRLQLSALRDAQRGESWSPARLRPAAGSQLLPAHHWGRPQSEVQ